LPARILLEVAATGTRLIEMNGTSGTFTIGPTGIVRAAAGLGGDVFFGNGNYFGGAMVRNAKKSPAVPRRI
jgi:hypothetical protein